MFKYEKSNFCNSIELAPVERVVEFTPSGLDVAEVSAVLSLAVDGRAVNVTAAEGYVEVEGRANFKLVYLDGEGAPKGVDYNADFKVRVEGDVTESDRVLARVSVAEADASLGNTLTLSAVISVSATVVRCGSEECLTDAENCYKTTEKITVPALVATASATVPVEDEAAAKDVTSVLFLDGAAAVRGVTAGANTITVEYSVYATVTYLEDGEIKISEYEIDGSEELEADGAAEGDSVRAEAMLKNARIVLAGVAGENIVRFEGDVVFAVEVFRCAETEVVADMFMLTNEVEPARTTRESLCFAGTKYYEEKVSGTVTLSGNEVSAVVIPSSRCYVAKAIVDGGEALVEGVVTAEVVFTDENGLSSVRAELPFSLSLGEGYEGEISAKATVKAVYAKSKKTGETEITAELLIAVSEYLTHSYSYISEVVVGEEKEVNTSGLSLYIASEGDGMWEVCRALTATPEMIAEQNPTVLFPLAEGERVVYFRALAN